MSDANQQLKEALEHFEIADDHHVEQEARRLLGVAEVALADAADVKHQAPAVRATWQRYLDLTGTRRFLLGLDEHALRYRWADTSFAAIQRADYGLRELLQRAVAQYPERTYLKERRHGVATSWSYQRIDRRLRTIAAAFHMAQEQRPRVALLTGNNLQGACCDLACLLHGIFVSPVNVHTDPEALVWIFDQLGINLVVTDSDDRCRMLSKIINKTQQPFQIVALCEEDRCDDAFLLAQTTARIGADEADEVLTSCGRPPLTQVATVLFTSGSTGRPKGVSFSHYQLVSKRFARHAALPDVGVDDGELLFTYLPLFHTFGRYLELLGMLYWGGTYVFAGNPSAETLLTGLREERPTGLISVPMRWQQIYDRCDAGLAEGRSDESEQRVVHEVTGGRLRWGLSAAGYLDPKVFRFFQQNGIAVCSGFGMTEGTGGITMSPPGDYRDDTVGMPLPGVEVRFGEMDELQIKGQYIARYLDDAGPDDLIDPHEDYWLPTGDLFQRLGDGHVRIVDRIKDIYKNSKGQTIAPRRVEQKFTGVPGIKRTFLVGDGRAHNVLLIVPDDGAPILDSVTDTENIEGYFGRLITAANRALAPYERVVNYALLERDFSLERDELTPKGSYRRKVIEEHFAETIDLLYRNRHVDLVLGELTLRIPRWFYRDLGLLETDIVIEGQNLVDERGGRRLEVGVVEDPSATGETWIRLGDLQYCITGTLVDLGLFTRQPWLWLGNGELTAFCPCKAGWDIPLRGVERQVRRVADVVGQQRSAPRLEGAHDPRLVDADRHIRAALFSDEEAALHALDAIEALLSRADERLTGVLRRRLETLAHHPAEQVRCSAYRILLLDEPMPDYGEVFPAFIASGKTFLDEASIQRIAGRDLQPQRLTPLRQRLHSYRRTLSWPVPAGARAQFEGIFQLLVNFVRRHPEYFSLVRAELAAWALLDQAPTLAACASEHLQTLVAFFDGWVEGDSVAASEGEWRSRVVFESSIPASDRARVIQALADPTFLRKSMLLAHNTENFSLEQVPPKGIWITQILTSSHFRRYRVAINTSEHYELQLVIRHKPPKHEELKTAFWAMVLSSDPFGAVVLPPFGYWRRDLRATTIGYLPDLSVWDKSRQYASAIAAGGDEPWARVWRKLFVRGIATIFSAWESSVRHIVPGCTSPTNVLAPELDFREGAVMLSLTDCSPYRQPTDLLEPILHNFYQRTVAHYPWCGQYLKREWIFDAAIEALGADAGRCWLEEVRAQLEDEPPLVDWPEIQERLGDYLACHESHPHIPLPVDNAIDRYRHWRRSNRDVPLKGQEDALLQFHGAYRLERYAEWTRFYLYRHTLFADAGESTVHAFDALLEQMFRHPDRAATQHVELSDLQATLDRPECREIFSRIIFPESLRAMEVETVGERERSRVVVRSEIVDRVGARYMIRRPTSPAEIGMVCLLFHNEKYPQQVHENDHYYLVFDGRKQIVGGISYQLREPQMAYIQAMVVARPVQRRGLGGALLDDFCTRMKERGVEVVKAHLLLNQLAGRRGFGRDPRWGGWVRFLSESEKEEDVLS
ncbi:MAG: GNAT family N-acetyltransferase [Deltaproteobacteria bacterium]|nr:GNAT family N-acetyltransferase [Deltaproteobacteria bacterium]